MRLMEREDFRMKENKMSRRSFLKAGAFASAAGMLAACGTPVTYLKRLSMGPLSLDETLRPGEFRHLTQEEIDKLQQAVGLVAADCQKNDNNFCEKYKKTLAKP